MEQYLMANPWAIWLLLLWTLPWKGVALWRAAKNNHRKWFIALFLVNTMAILEIIYIFYFSKPRSENLTASGK
ncbi:MAG: hypothetical protein COW72_01110 [Candidatus Nealsonbacteria bacterium CG18_big_fil_WC_8_21_14_2_50_37_10]|uniref:DUF5652 domain-containing protein n=1 Tax=Candidatus Nealsonbacteria bacterium CG18_big_fil_WC_8_21_14_2_50_37_10 TaxID=1974717 RepID=A0A2H0FKH9_9BACT|nr:MAG: hypothetical protein COW72_01110 [Candidatus Nealsonbacteria bacterium CG18_big_fil_WC_8_21_14_2_50_37_10]